MAHTLTQKRAEYARLRAQLEKILGPVCAKCGDDGPWAADHEGGTRVYSARRMNSIARLRLYIKESQKGGVRRLCHNCNGVDGDKRRFYTESVVDDSVGG